MHYSIEQIIFRIVSKIIGYIFFYKIQKLVLYYMTSMSKDQNYVKSTVFALVIKNKNLFCFGSTLSSSLSRYQCCTYFWRTVLIPLTHKFFFQLPFGWGVGLFCPKSVQLLELDNILFQVIIIFVLLPRNLGVIWLASILASPQAFTIIYKYCLCDTFCTQATSDHCTPNFVVHSQDLETSQTYWTSFVHVSTDLRSYIFMSFNKVKSFSFVLRICPSASTEVVLDHLSYHEKSFHP